MKPRRLLAFAGVLAVLCSGCSRGPGLQPAPEVPARSPTPGDELLALVPAGPSVIVEIDADRLRRNAAVGPLTAALGARPDDPEDAELVKLFLGILRHSDAAVIAVYDAGKDSARTLILLHALAAAGQGRAVRLNPRTHALGPPELIERARELAGGAPRPTVGDDPEWLSIRAHPMPAKATGAALRVTARLSFDARVELASRFELDAVPHRLALWGDVADDLAVVALMGTENPREAQVLADAVRSAEGRLRALPAGARLLLAPVVRGLEVKTEGPLTRATVVIGPRALAALVDSMLQLLPRKEPDPQPCAPS